MEAVRSGGDLRNVGGSGKYTKDVVCPDGCVIFRLTATPTGEANFFAAAFSPAAKPLIDPGLRPSPLPRRDFMRQQREKATGGTGAPAGTVISHERQRDDAQSGGRHPEPKFRQANFWACRWKKRRRAGW